MKDGVDQNAILAVDADVSSHTFEIDNISYDFYWNIFQSRPKWVELFSGLENFDTESMRTRGVQGLLVFKRQERIFCFTFGHARHLIDPLAIERYFGFKVALSLSDPDAIKSIDKSTIDKVPFRSRSQSSKYVSISQFEFRFDWEILKSLTGIVDVQDEDSDYEVVTGSDSVSLFTDVSLQTMPLLADRLLNAINDESYKEKYPGIDYIVPVRDRVLVEQLDLTLINKINEGDFESAWLAPPALIEYENFSGFCYKRRHTRSSSQLTYPDLDLAQCLRDKRMDALEVESAKSTQIFLYGDNDQLLTTWPLYHCLNGEIQMNDDLFVLSDGEWYQVEMNFCSQINRYFDEFPRSDLILPNYDGKHEGPYLNDVADNENFFLMDQKFVRPEGASSNIEFCDLLTREDHLIHVKKYSSSSVLSHLFSQAYVSAESLLQSPDLIEQINGHLPESKRFAFDSSAHPRPSKIILAVMQHRSGDLHMPFFSKVNFKQYSQKLKNMGFSVELLKIAL